MNKQFKSFRTLGVAFLGLTLLASCNDDDDNNGGNEAEFSVELRNDEVLGSILTDKNGQSLYLSAGDVTGTSNCSGGCATVWPAFKGDLDEFGFGDGLDEDDFSTLEDNHITYKGWPLYHFTVLGENDERVLENLGETNGDGANNFFIAKPDYDILLGKQEIDEEELVYLVNERRVAIYFKADDSNNTSSCDEACSNVWPAVEKALAGLVIPSTLDIEDFSQTSDGEGGNTNQLSYANQPLYYFSPTAGGITALEAPGEVGGDNINGFFVMKPVAPANPE